MDVRYSVLDRLVVANLQILPRGEINIIYSHPEFEPIRIKPEHWGDIFAIEGRVKFVFGSWLPYRRGRTA